MQYIEKSTLQTILSNDHPKIVLYVMSDHRHHSLQNEISCIYVKTTDGEFYSSFSHPDFPQQSADGLVINNAYTTNIKDLMNLGVDVYNSVDILYFQDIKSDDKLNQFYQIKLGTAKNINNVVPIFNHIENLKDVAKSLTPTKIDDKYKTMYHHLMPFVFSSIEGRGVPVNNESFAHYYGEDKQYLVRENRVYTSYNLYTTTGRPSNTHGGINYAALNKTDGSRQTFSSDNLLINIDFNSYHLHLIANKLGIQIPDDLHSWLGKQYFGTENLTNDQYEEAKKITFKNLYGYQLEERVKNIELFRQVEQFQERLWSSYQQVGYVVTDYNNHIVVENPSKNKVFNYYIQALETETNIKQLYALITKELIPILYTYDSMVFEISMDQVEQTRDILKETLLFPYTVKVGHNLDF